MDGFTGRGQSAPPELFLPFSSAPEFDGLKSSQFNPIDEDYFYGRSTKTYPVFDMANATDIPNPSPAEDFENVNYQLFGPEAPTPTPKWPNMGFVINYSKVTGTNIPVQVMEPFSPTQVPVISHLARHYAVSDAWFSSVPSGCWPNRAFSHAGTSNGKVNSGTFPNPFEWDIPNIFNVLEDTGVSWRVYTDSLIVPSLTYLMFPNLWAHSGRFRQFGSFKVDCADDRLAQYTFIEPSFLDNPNDERPPNDVLAGEQFLYEIWQAVIQSPAWSKTLLLVTFDGHGGNYDHVFPPFGAAPPDVKSDPGEENFNFNRFGVRVPAILISPWIQSGTVFRSPIDTPYDHTSILATLRDWLSISSDNMLNSKRIASAPTLEQVLTLPRARVDTPSIPRPRGEGHTNSRDKALNPLQKSLASAYAMYEGQKPAEILSRIHTRQDAIGYFLSKMNPAERPAILRKLIHEPTVRDKGPIKSLTTTFDVWDAGLLIVNGEIWEDSKVEEKAGSRTGNFHGSSVSKLAKLSLQDLAGYFDSLTIWLPDTMIAPDEWGFGQIEIELDLIGADHVQVICPMIYDLEFWAKPYSIADLATAIEEALAVPQSPFIYWQRSPQTAIDGFGVSMSISREDLVESALAKQEGLTRFSKVIREALEGRRAQTIDLVFDFPPAIRSACEQYLLYFGQFLRDIGIDARAEIKERASEVLFSVTPVSEKQALEQVREALDVYLRLPAAPEFGVAASGFYDVAVSQLKSNVLHLQSQIVLARAALEMKNATIEAKDAQLGVLQEKIDLLLFQPKSQIHPPEPEKEELVKGIVAVKKWDYKFLEFNFPGLLRRLKRK